MRKIKSRNRFFKRADFFYGHWPKIWYTAALVLYLILASYQLGLPGVHYDEAKEAGINAMELWQGAPVTAFRGATLALFGLELPLMVQDYIGALNVYLTIPFLALSGVGVPNLRLLPILIGLASLITLERAISHWLHNAKVHNSQFTAHNSQISLAGLYTLTLLVASPSFIFWSRQGIFVTNLTQPLCFLCIGQGLRWFRLGNGRAGAMALLSSAFAGGLALYAKLMAIWMVGPFSLLMVGWWLKRWLFRHTSPSPPNISLPLFLGAIIAFMLPLIPLFIFNWQTNGTFSAIFGNLDQSYYGVDNWDIGQNLQIRWQQLMQALRGDHFWYLGGLYTNQIAPWLGGLAILVGLWRRRGLVIGPLLLLMLMLMLSLFTISDLFVTHYALLQPLAIAVVGISLSTWVSKLPSLRFTKYALSLLLTLWLAFDLTATINYHHALNRSGGVADHSDATYHLAYHLRYNGMGAPIALDWGLDAPVRFLSEGAVRPIEIFGYESPQAPDEEFNQRLDHFLANQENIYLLHAPEQTVFVGRRELFMEQLQAQALIPILEKQFAQQDGTVLFELWRVGQ